MRLQRELEQPSVESRFQRARGHEPGSDGREWAR